MKTLKELYLEMRQPHFVPWSYRHANKTNPMMYRAAMCLSMARQQMEGGRMWKKFQDMGGEVIYHSDWNRRRHTFMPCVAIIEHPDEGASIDDLEGDMFNPDVNTDIPRRVLERERKEFVQRVERDGVFGYRAMFRQADGTWMETDSIWGVIGNEFGGSGYDADLIRSCVEAYEEQQEENDRLLQMAEEME